jgi:hypothetical protein
MRTLKPRKNENTYSRPNNVKISAEPHEREGFPKYKSSALQSKESYGT